jgi:hypothetical protein
MSYASMAGSNRRRIVGKMKADNAKDVKLKGAAIRAWHLYIGNLDKETDETVLKEHLEANDVEVIKIYKLKATKDWQKNTSAFKVIVNRKHKEAVFNEDIWPDDVDVRDWFFKPSAGTNEEHEVSESDSQCNGSIK